MTTAAAIQPDPPVRPGQSNRRDLHIGRVVLGALVGAAGIGWLLDEMGYSVPWNLYPAVGLAVIGLGLLVTLFVGRGRGLLIWLGVAALIAATAVGVGAERYSGPVGDLVVTPTPMQWPVEHQISAGTITLDLSRHLLPETGTATVEVGAGRLLVILPTNDARIHIDARTTAGTVRLDGADIADGVDVRWSKPAQATPPVIQLNLQVGLGDIEVKHENA